MILEYVASGLSHISMNNSSVYNYPDDPLNKEILEFHKNLIAMVKSKTNHNFSYLFNAYQEVKLGRDITSSMRPYVDRVYSDSGGLQIVTRGVTIDEVIKSSIYKVQSDYSDIAMSFDEIPVVTPSGRSIRGDIEGRKFDYTSLNEKAFLSGKNIAEQVDHLNMQGKNCKPMMIVHCNDHESHDRWMDKMLEGIGETRFPYISGIASSTASLGAGVLEDTKRYYYYGRYKYPSNLNSKHLHLLGVGSLQRIISLVALIQSGLFPNDILLSYDSTSHTSNVSSGSYYKNAGRCLDLGRQRNDDYYWVLNDVNIKLREHNLPEVKDDDFFLYLCQRSSDTYHKNLDDTQKIIKYAVYNAFFYCQLLNFMLDLERIFSDTEYYNDYLMQRKLYIPLNALKYVRDDKDFDEWGSKYSKQLKSRGIKPLDDGSNSLETFF